MSRLSIHKQNWRDTEINTRMVVLKNTIPSLKVRSKQQPLLKEFMLHRWLRTNTNCQDGTKRVQHRRHFKAALSTNERTDSDIQALKVIEGRVDQQQTVTSDSDKMNRLEIR
jgi:hypothetical protein